MKWGNSLKNQSFHDFKSTFICAMYIVNGFFLGCAMVTLVPLLKLILKVLQLYLRKKIHELFPNLLRKVFIVMHHFLFTWNSFTLFYGGDFLIFMSFFNDNYGFQI